jgi:hypothetical protein
LHDYFHNPIFDPLISKYYQNTKTKKIYILDIFASFLIFSATSQKNLEFKNFFLICSILTHHFQKNQNTKKKYNKWTRRPKVKRKNEGLK